ncbi:MAG TPA: hypothetical protein VMH83_07180, partial [Candidatus Acidoferrum sp.]|nr:hypothetical protein [Candidatus Acidoferrum sp.]
SNGAGGPKNGGGAAGGAGAMAGGGGANGGGQAGNPGAQGAGGGGGRNGANSAGGAIGGIGGGAPPSGGGGGGGDGNDPFANLGTPGGGPMTAAERRAALDAQLNASYAAFDGVILSERERAVAKANEAGSGVMGTTTMGSKGGGGKGGKDGTSDDGTGGGLGGRAAQANGRVISGNGNGGGDVVATTQSTSSGVGTGPTGGPARQGDYNFSNQPYFAPPADIPPGNDDDVVARQLREAAVHEPDPALRDKLWDEYRKYTGLKH